MLSAVGLRVAGLSLPAVVFWWCEGAQGHSLLCLRKKLHQEATCKAVIFRWAFCLWGYFASSRRAFAHALSLGLLRVLSPRVRARTPRRARAPQRDARFPPRVRRSAVLAFCSCAASRFAARGGDSSSRSFEQWDQSKPRGQLPCLMAARRRRFYRPSCLGAFCGELHAEATAPAPRRVVRRAPTKAVLPAPTAFVNADRGANRAECAAAAAAPSIPPLAPQR